MQVNELPRLMDTIPLNRSEISQSQLNIEQKERSNLFPWNGQFSPQLIETFLGNYASSDSKVFDPFLGSGTILAEAAARNLEAVGTEINPAAHQFAVTYSLCSMGVERRKDILTFLESSLAGMLDPDLPLFKGNLATGSCRINDELVTIYRRMRRPDAKSLLKTLILLLDGKTKEVDSKRLVVVWKRLKNLILSLPTSNSKQVALNRDARRTGLKANQFDLVITSPPYINVFNYHQNYRATSEEFGHDLLDVAKAEIGSNRKHRGNRFLTVIQYILDMTAVFNELKRVCTSDARIIFVVGRESNVRKTRFLNGEIVTSVATRCSDFRPVLRQERVFTNRFGARIFEDIIHFKPSANLEKIDPYDVAIETLNSAAKYVDAEAVDDLMDAIKRFREVQPSPEFIATSGIEGNA